MNEDFLKTDLILPGQVPPRVQGPAQLVTIEGLRTGASYPLLKERTTIGRLPDNDVVLASGPVSKRHASMTQQDGVFYIEDLGSTNGVLVNTMRLPADSKKRLYHGDNIRISDHLLLFRQESSFVDGEGSCAIKLDQKKIEAEVSDFLAEWRNLQQGGRGTTGL